MKTLISVLAITFLFVSTVALANPAINGKHAGKENGGKKVNCAYCHTDAKIEKKKGLDLAAAKKNASCQGAACHK